MLRQYITLMINIKWLSRNLSSMRQTRINLCKLLMIYNPLILKPKVVSTTNICKTNAKIFNFGSRSVNSIHELRKRIELRITIASYQNFYSQFSACCRETPKPAWHCNRNIDDKSGIQLHGYLLFTGSDRYYLTWIWMQVFC